MSNSSQPGPGTVTLRDEKDDGWHRKLEVMARLLKVFSLAHLEQIASAAEACAGREEMPDLVIRWKNGHPRWIGTMEWDVLGRDE